MLRDFRKPFLFVLLLAAGPAGAQVMSADMLVARALANSRNVMADSLAILQQQHLVRSSVNIPNPEVFWESPTGNFYTGSITQSIEFPTVYTRQRQLQRQRVALAGQEKKVTEAELGLQVRRLYLQFQLAVERERQLRLQDSVYRQIQAAAKRQFGAGQIDYMQQLYAETQYGEVHTRSLTAAATARAVRRQLQYLAALPDSFAAEPLDRLPLTAELIELLSGSPLPAPALPGNPRLSTLAQQEAISRANIGLQRSKALPGLAIGYFNQGERETPLQNRFRAGITIPVWFWQYSGNIRAARAEAESARLRTEGYRQQLGVQYQQLYSEWEGARELLSYFEQTALAQSEEMIRTAERLFRAGEGDYVTYLRNTTEAYNIRQRYLDALANYNESMLQLRYLTGQL